MSQHLVILPIVLPAVMAGVLLLLRAGLAVQRALGGAGALALVVLGLVNLQAAAGQGPAAYFLGNWPAPFGIVLVRDGLSALMLALTAVLALIVLAHAVLTGWDARGRHFHALMMFQLMGLNGAFLTADAFNLFVFFEVLLIASYGLLVHGGGAARLRVGMQYVIFNLLGSTVFLFALATIYAVTGTLNMADLAQKLPLLPPGDAPLLRVALVLLLVVFAVKGAMVPLQFWLPGAYAAAPPPVAALLAVMSKLGAYAMLRFGTLVFPPDLAASGRLWGDVIWAGGLAGVVMGALGVLAAPHLRAMVGFASISSMGAIFMAISFGSAPAIAAALYYALHSTLAAAALFLICDHLFVARGGDDFAQGRAGFAGSGRLAVLFALAAVAMLGLPPLSGFLGKIMLLQAMADQAGLAWFAILGGSLVMLMGFARAGSALFWRQGAGPRAEEGATNVAPYGAALLPLCALLAGLVGMTLVAGPMVAGLQGLAQGLLDPAAYIAVQALGGAVP